MTRLALAAIAALVPFTTLQAVPISCNDPTMATLADYITQSAAGGCFVQDKLFTNFSYTGGGAVTAASVNVDPVFSALPGTEIHGFVFNTTVGVPVWVTGFTLAYTIAVDPPDPLINMTAAKTQANFGILANPSSVTNTLGNGVVQTVILGDETKIDTFAAVQSLTVSNVATIPGGGFLISLENNFRQTLIPEPASNILIGAGLLAVAAFARKRRAAR